MKVSIIIPVYNEFRTFRQVLERVRRAPLPAGCTREIIVVDDGSSDGTTEMLGEQTRAGILIGHYTVKNAGKGAAIRAGLALASGDIVLIQDGDLEYDPNDYARLLEPIVQGEARIVYGSRFLAQQPAMPRSSRLANRLLAAAANLLYAARITDEATAYKAFDMAVLRGMQLYCRRFEFCPEVTAKARRLGYRIREVPVSYNARGVGEGKKIRARDGVQALWTLLKYRFVPRRRLTR
jgi:glycosyltransferase involved in cell wall biosynthesis